jgi:E3 ubiquitin-protein ligase DOA10
MEGQFGAESYLAIGYPDNPELEEARCRICYLTSRPLIIICECSGTIEYVHEECVIEWITKKIELSELLEIPKCELCQTPYNAQLKVGKRKVCPDILLAKVRELPKKQLVHALVYSVGTLVALWTLLLAFFGQLLGVM